MTGTRSSLLRQRLNEDRILTAIGAHDGLTARVAEQTGAECLYVSGYAIAAHYFGLPDIGLTTLDNVASVVTRIRAVTDLPLVVDADTAYGAEAAARRTVRTLEGAGANAIQIEDQTFPKRCGHLANKSVIDVGEMQKKVEVAANSRASADTLIIARTDSLQPNGIEDAIARSNAYVHAGADMAFVDAPRTLDDIKHIGDAIDAPVLINLSETGRTPAVSVFDLEKMGYDMAIFPTTQTWVFTHAYERIVRTIIEHGSTVGMQHEFTSFDEVNRILGLDAWDSL